MKLLTVRQPWAEAIADGAKLTENRAQGFPKGYRGLLGIHAGLGWSVRGQRSPLIRATYGVEHRVDPELFNAMVRGAVIALAELVDVHPAAGCCAPWGEDTYPPASPEQRPPGQVTHLVLDHVVRIRPVPASGRLGLWNPDDDLRIELAHRLAELVTWDLAAAQRVADRGDVAQLWAVVQDDLATSGGT